MVNKKKKKCSLCNLYRETWNYLKESKNYIWFVLFIFILSAVIGFIFPIFFVDEIKEFVKSIIELTKDLNMLQMVLFIFKNNIQSSFFGILFGFFLGLFPLIASIANGYMLGFISKAVVNEVGYFQLWRLLPHGIFEIPAVMISLGLGVKLGMFIFAKNPKKEIIRRFKLSVKTFFLIILPLLIIAAIIEGVLIVLLE